MLILPLPGNEALAKDMAGPLGADLAELETRRFPDGESYVRVRSEVRGREVVIVCTLTRPDEQFLRLVFAARTARERGATRLTLVAPYLAYMRQDKAFQEGEAVTSAHFAGLLSAEFDRLITIDPHLHRHKALAEIYAIPALALHAAPLLADWIKANVADPLIVGPDEESEQWAAAIAAGTPSVVLRKTRGGDREVAIDFPDLSPWSGRQPVLVDDIASSGRTLIEACQGLTARGFAKPICIVVHPLFADDSFKALSGVAGRVVSTDTIPHETNAISVAGLLARALRE
jgi:ribose-phosphate pyrophosphokinase